MTETLTLLDELFEEKGLLASSLDSYEPRDGQQEMAKTIWEAFEEEKVGLFEAGTGIGKSLAYLIPALLFSYRTGEKIVISTYTISLQEQLLKKDIPLLMKALGLDLRVVLAKGMGNYVCMRKLDDAEGIDGVEAIAEWSKETKDGSKSALPFSVSRDLWSEVFAESEACSYVKCPHYKSCFFFKARQKVQEADIILVNHHLLMAHLLSDESRAILPPFTRIVIDEAHHLEEVARSALTRGLDRVRLYKSMGRIHSDSHPEGSRFLQMRDILHEQGQKKLATRLGIDLPGEKRELLKKAQSAFDALDDLYDGGNSSQKWRLTEQVMRGSEWKESIAPAFEALASGLKRYTASLDALEDDLDDELKEKVELPLFDIQSASERLKETEALITDFFREGKREEVRWAERFYEGTSLSLAELDVAPYLEEKLFSTLKSSILCSATMTVAGSFEHLKAGCGLTSQDCYEKLLPSPFDYQDRVRLLGLSDLPAPSGFGFAEAATQAIQEAIRASGGGAFVLFTSYSMLNECARLFDHPALLKQGDLPRHLLLEKFKEENDSVLFGTDSFWEGVDVAGDALRLVIIVKLPFPVPSEPLLQARSEALKAAGKDPFMDDSVPQAVVKFKQGFGRLMRRKSDRGCVLCLDQRLFTRGYGRLFMESLPDCVTSFAGSNAIFSEMRNFYR